MAWILHRPLLLFVGAVGLLVAVIVRRPTLALWLAFGATIAVIAAVWARRVAL